MAKKFTRKDLTVVEEMVALLTTNIEFIANYEGKEIRDAFDWNRIDNLFRGSNIDPARHNGAIKAMAIRDKYLEDIQDNTNNHGEFHHDYYWPTAHSHESPTCRGCLMEQEVHRRIIFLPLTSRFFYPRYCVYDFEYHLSDPSILSFC